MAFTEQEDGSVIYRIGGAFKTPLSTFYEAYGDRDYAGQIRLLDPEYTWERIEQRMILSELCGPMGRFVP